MKLGIHYMVFDGEELLEFAIKSIRNVVDYICVTYQETSYFGNKVDPNVLETFKRLQDAHLIDDIIPYQTDLSIHHKENELNLRNLGLDASIKAGCTHHISADVDEFYKEKELEYAKNLMYVNNYDLSTVYQEYYYKEPTYLVTPSQNLPVSFIIPVTNRYDRRIKTKLQNYETTKKVVKYDNIKVFNHSEIIQHHMSYVRKDIRKKFANSDNAQYYELEKFIQNHENYKLGGRVCLLPEYLNRKTIEVENIFNIHL